LIERSARVARSSRAAQWQLGSCSRFAPREEFCPVLAAEPLTIDV
jgi:hypothetical protein